MEVFFVDGSVSSFADIILKHKNNGGKCLVASYGFGVVQVRKIINAFDFVCLLADISHAQLNTDAYNTIIEMNTVLPNFTFIAKKTHAKLALIDDETFIFTSANLSANQRMESYVIGKYDEVDGIGKLNEIFLSGGRIEKLIPKIGDNNAGVFKIIRALYLDPRRLNEPRYTHTIDDEN